MKEFIDKLIERLEAIEEHCLDMHDWQGQSAIVEAKEIVNKLAEEHKDDIQTIDVSELLGEQVNDGWIACEKELPKNGVVVDLSCEYMGCYYETVGYLKNGNRGHSYIVDNDVFMRSAVLAWRKRPAPYQPKGE